MSKRKRNKYLNLDINQLFSKRKTKNSCKIEKGIIKQINKKIFIGATMFVISSTTLTGCKAYGFSYQTNSEGVRYATGSVDSDYINDCYYLEIYNKTFNDYECYITVKQNDYGKVSYLDIFTLDTIYVEDEDYKNVDEVNIISVDEYLDSKNINKKSYSVDYMKEILEALIEENTQKNKQLIK